MAPTKAKKRLFLPPPSAAVVAAAAMMWKSRPKAPALSCGPVGKAASKAETGWPKILSCVCVCVCDCKLHYMLSSSEDRDHRSKGESIT